VPQQRTLAGVRQRLEAISEHSARALALQFPDQMIDRTVPAECRLPFLAPTKTLPTAFGQPAGIRATRSFWPFTAAPDARQSPFARPAWWRSVGCFHARLTSTGLLDAGYFGQGLYLTFDADCAWHGYGGPTFQKVEESVRADSMRIQKRAR
jgi:hypothetical protein